MGTVDTAERSVELASQATEQELLRALACVELGDDRRQSAERALESGVDTAAVVELASQHQVLPLVYHQLSNTTLGKLAATDLYQTAQRGFYASLARNNQLLAIADRACAALVSAGCTPVRLKGAHLAAGLYPVVALRPMADIDLLVRTTELDTAVSALRDVGFNMPGPAAQGDYYFKEHFHLPLYDASGQCLELHWRLADRYTLGRARSELFIDTACPMDRTAPERGQVLDNAWNILYLSIHLAKHAVFNHLIVGREDFGCLAFYPSTDNRLIWYADIVELAKRADIDWQELEHAARGLGVLEALQTTLAASQCLFGHEVLPEAARRVARAELSWRSSVAGFVLGRLQQAGKDSWLLSMHKGTQVRPLRLLLLPDTVFPSLRSFALRHVVSLPGAVWRYPFHVISTIARGVLSAFRHVRHGLLGSRAT